MHKLTVTLKQHTPLIHFQHDQDDATLRASEVKPKLDKYILSKLTQENCEKGEKEGWIKKKNDKVWLDYKMRIEAVEEKPEEFMLASYIKEEFVIDLRKRNIKAISNTPFFAQEKQNTSIRKSKNPQIEWNKIEKKGLLFKGDIILSIIVKDETLSVKIKNYIQSFFVATNFGTRQSKGFGCFSIIELKFDNQKQILSPFEDLLVENFSFVYKKTLNNVQDAQSEQGISIILQTINDDYKLLKSGLSRPYAKSKLMLYVDSLNRNVGWEKKYIKTNTNDTFYTTEDDECYRLKCQPRNVRESYSKKDDYRYYRALLGLAEQFEFLLENPPQNDYKHKMIIKVKNEEVQRYQSPILFKVSDNVIYIVGNEIAQDMLNQSFEFMVNFQGDDRYENEPVSEDGTPIYTPSEFSLRKFISFAMNNTVNRGLNYQTVKR